MIVIKALFFQAKEYGGCVAARVPKVERDMCLKEFVALRNCMQNVVLLSKERILCQRPASRLNDEDLSNMIGKASSSQPTVGFSGSGTMSHVYIQYPPLRCKVSGSVGLFYDDENKLLLSPTSDQVVSWKISPFSPHVAPTVDSITGGPVLSLRYSLDAKLLAIQRSSHEVQFWIRQTGESFSQRYRSESENLLGFFWTDCPTCDIVFVKTSGLDLFSYNSELKSLHLVESKKLNVSWYVYTHESRLVLLASGMQCKSFTGYQLSSAGIIHLPRFEMAMAKSEANSKPVLAAEDVHIVTVYGRIYCLQIDRVAMLLQSYRFYRDAVVQQGSLPIYSSKIAVSVVDSVLLVHQVDVKVVILYDIFADSRAPISAPLPLLLRSSPSVNVSSAQSRSKDAEGSEVRDSSYTESIIYGDDWNFLVPDLICDVANGYIWKIHLDLEASFDGYCCEQLGSAISARILAAKEAGSKEGNLFLVSYRSGRILIIIAKQLCLAISRTIILERRPVSMVARAIDVLVTSFSYSLKTGGYVKGTKVEKISPSGAPHVNSPNSVADESISRVDVYGKSVKHEPAGGIENESVNQSTFPMSDSEDSAIFETPKIYSPDLHSSGGKPDSDNLISSEVHPPAPQSQVRVQGNNPLNANVSEQQESQVTSAAISPDEMYSSVFAPVEEEMGGDASYLVAIIIEYLRSANLEKVKVYPSISVLTVRLLTQNERYAELGLFIINKILEPSKEVALQLLESGRQSSQTRKLGLDILRQLLLHHDYVVLLVQDGYYLEALRYARKNKVNTVRPSLFLEAAYASNDSQHLAAVLRFFSDFIPGFRSTADHNTYCRILAEMNSSVTA
ncbi:hypothetical protein RJ639_045339 [Escallonia herrerae]|uniref:Mic1 domain-containing protein n=1 Tax=Escallonia herrerae TaxID=1293975 RepID=A0AA89AYM1_9ASTE|nr:hypothetical protein RJ639_045339 [Escallonia herrerae]